MAGTQAEPAGNAVQTARRRLLGFAAAVEIATGLALMIVPGVVATLLLGVDLAPVAMVLARCFGIAMLTLGMACWPGGRQAAPPVSTWGAMLTYNALIALYLAYLGGVAHLQGMLLWPAVGLHTAVALLLIGTMRGGR
jgi:hypothetical protein